MKRLQVGRRLRNVRTIVGFSKGELAELAVVEPDRIEHLERGLGDELGRTECVRIAEALNVNVSLLTTSHALLDLELTQESARGLRILWQQHMTKHGCTRFDCDTLHRQLRSFVRTVEEAGEAS